MSGRTSKKSKSKSVPGKSPAPEVDPTIALIALGQSLINAASSLPVSEVKRLIKAGAPTWYQEDTMGWSALHFAAERGDVGVVRALLEGGGVWNSVDLQGNTPADISLSVNDEASYTLIRNEGIRSEMLIHLLSSKPPPFQPAEAETDGEPSTSTADPSSSTTAADASSNTLTLRSSDPTSAGDNLTFLKSKLVWDVGEDGRERVLDADGNGVMMGWETLLMEAHVKYMCETHPDCQPGARGLTVLNVGYGLGIIDALLQSHHPKPKHHIIIEAHPQVLAHLRESGFDKTPGVTVLEGRWQDWVCEERMGELLGMTEGGEGFGGVFVDTFAEGYEDLKAFFEFLPDLLNGPDATFSFWNGLGATNPTIYDVASHLAELHLEDVGMTVEWHDIPVPESTAQEVWNGVRRKYWDMMVYKLPVARMSL